MRKLFTSIAVCLGLLSASAQNGYTVKTLTFEDNDYVSDTPNYLGQKNWSSLIDSPQYGGDLLYGENHGDTTKVYSDVNYRWYDKGNTGLYSELPLNWGTHMYWGGGHAISDYWDGNLQNGDYTHQLSVYVPNNTSNGRGGHGHNGSDNFCVHYGYHDNSGYSAENLPWFKFKDGGYYVIDGMWINNTTYFVNCVTNGNGLTAALGANEYVMIEAKGYRSDGTTRTLYTPLASGSGYLVTDWTGWSLAELGPVNKVEFNVVGNSDNGYGFSQPAYFCYDDVQVKIPTNDNNNTKKIQTRSENEIKHLVVGWDYNSSKTLSVRWNDFMGSVAEGFETEYTTNVEDYNIGELYNAGEEYTLTLKGLPQNATITKIEGNIHIGMNVKSTININIGDKQIVNYSYGSFLNNDKDFPFLGMLSNPTLLAIPFLEKADTNWTGDIKFHQTMVDGAPVGSAPSSGCGHFHIYYKIDDTSTGISEIAGERTASDAVYTLQGVRVSNPVKGQIYIKNGKKFIMK